jgi:hypothetical protein
MVATAGYVQEEMLVRDNDRPSLWRNHLLERGQENCSPTALPEYPQQGCLRRRTARPPSWPARQEWQRDIVVYFRTSILPQCSVGRADRRDSELNRYLCLVFIVPASDHYYCCVLLTLVEALLSAGAFIAER